jgi:transcriptional regulator with XRE-family HTH domain
MWGIKLKKLIKKNKLSQKELAAATSTPESSVSIWINQVNPPLEFIEKCCNYMDIPLWQFFAPDNLIIPDLKPYQSKFMNILKELPEKVQAIIIEQAAGTAEAFEAGKSN